MEFVYHVKSCRPNVVWSNWSVRLGDLSDLRRAVKRKIQSNLALQSTIPATVRPLPPQIKRAEFPCCI